MDSLASNRKYKNITAALILAIIVLSMAVFLLFIQSRNLRASLKLANERIVSDSLLINKYKLVDDELLKIISAYDSNGLFKPDKENLVSFVGKIFEAYEKKNNVLKQRQLYKEIQIDRLKSKVLLLENKAIELENNTNVLEFHNKYSQSKISLLELDLKISKNIVDSISSELEKVGLELSKTAIDSLIIYSPNGNRIYYYGKVVNQNPAGFGIGFYEGKGYYIGEWKGNLRNGWGKHTFKDNSAYEGYFESDIRSGFGTYYYNSGDIYKGDWKNDLMDGKGEILRTDGKSVKGVWSSGKLINIDR